MYVSGKCLFLLIHVQFREEDYISEISTMIFHIVA